jgi:hypothetical protein
VGVYNTSTQDSYEGANMITTKSPIVPKEYAGKWIAWNCNQTEIVASGQTADEAEDLARKRGEEFPILAKVPLSDVRLLGGR